MFLHIDPASCVHRDPFAPQQTALHLETRPVGQEDRSPAPYDAVPGKLFAS